MRLNEPPATMVALGDKIAVRASYTPECLSEVFGGKRCTGRCFDPKDCSGSPIDV